VVFDVVTALSLTPSKGAQVWLLRQRDNRPLLWDYFIYDYIQYYSFPWQHRIRPLERSP
jgi:hypothetical protein